MSDLRAVDIVAAAGAYSTTKPDKLRDLESRIEAWVAENDYEEDDLLQEIRRLISGQIVGLEIGDGYRVIGAQNKLYRVTKGE